MTLCERGNFILTSSEKSSDGTVMTIVRSLINYKNKSGPITDP